MIAQDSRDNIFFRITSEYRIMLLFQHESMLPMRGDKAVRSGHMCTPASLAWSIA